VLHAQEVKMVVVAATSLWEKNNSDVMMI